MVVRGRWLRGAGERELIRGGRRVALALFVACAMAGCAGAAAQSSPPTAEPALALPSVPSPTGAPAIGSHNEAGDSVDSLPILTVSQLQTERAAGTLTGGPIAL